MPLWKIPQKSQRTQLKRLWLPLPGGLWVEMADSWANRRGRMIFLRCLRTAAGRPLVSYERLAEGLGYADRRNVHNFWMEFEACGSDLEAFLLRRKKIDGSGRGSMRADLASPSLVECRPGAYRIRSSLAATGGRRCGKLISARRGHHIGFLGHPAGLASAVAGRLSGLPRRSADRAVAGSGAGGRSGESRGSRVDGFDSRGVGKGRPPGIVGGSF